MIQIKLYQVHTSILIQVKCLIPLLEDVCFWTHYHRVILIKSATPDDEQNNEKHSDIEEVYLKSLKKNVIIIHRDKPEIGWK